jgi:hypothetical protein
MRIVATAVLISMCHVPFAFAGDTLRQAAVREAEKLAAAEVAAARANQTASAPIPAVVADRPVGKKPQANFQQAPRGLEGASGLSTRMKILIGVGIAAAVVGIMSAIDGSVEDNTPSTKGERTNEPF